MFLTDDILAVTWALDMDDLLMFQSVQVEN